MLETSLENICTMPLMLKMNRNQNSYSLLKTSGYLIDPDAVTEDLIEQYLRARPHLVKAWLHHSQDQRSSPSWYLKAPDSCNPDEAGWSVGFVPRPYRRIPADMFKDGYVACARFIKRYAHHVLRDHLSGAS